MLLRLLKVLTCISIIALIFYVGIFTVWAYIFGAATLVVTLLTIDYIVRYVVVGPSNLETYIQQSRK